MSYGRIVKLIVENSALLSLPIEYFSDISQLRSKDGKKRFKLALGLSGEGFVPRTFLYLRRSRTKIHKYPSRQRVSTTSRQDWGFR